MRARLLFAAVCVALIAEPANARTIYVITHQSASISKLSQQDLEQIYLLRQLYWPDGKPIVPVNREASSDLREFFSSIILKQSLSSLNSYWSQMHFRGKSPPVIQSSKESVVAFVRKIPGAIGYVEDWTGASDIKVVAELP